MPEANIRVDGFVIKVTNYSERDRYITLLTKDRGIISILCRGIRSRSNQFLSLTDIYTYAQFELFEINNKYYFSSATSIYEFKNLRLSLIEQTAISQMIELINDFLPNSDDEYTRDEIEEANQIYKLLIRAIYYSEEREDDIKLILSIFTYKLLTIMGFGLNLSHYKDGNKIDTDFNSSEVQLFFSFKDRRFFKVRAASFTSDKEEKSQSNNNSYEDKIIMPQVDAIDIERNKQFTRIDKDLHKRTEINNDTIPLSKDLYRSLVWISEHDISTCYNFSLSLQNKNLLYIFIKRFLQEQVDKEYKKLTLLENLMKMMKKN